MTLTFIVPMPPNIANRPMHHMVKHRVKVGYWALLDLMYRFGYDHAALTNLGKIAARTKIKTLRVQIEQAQAFAAQYVSDHARDILTAGPPVASRWEKASIHSVMHVGARMDVGNAMNRHKWVEDWLTERGFIVDDSDKHLTWEGFPEQVVKRDGNYRIELRVTPL